MSSPPGARARAGHGQGPAEDPDQPFTGRPRRLEQVLRVQPDTVVLVLGDDRPTVRRPGETLLPGLNPFRAAPVLLPVCTAVIPLRVAVDDLVTFDGERVERVTLRVPVQLAEADGFAVAAELAARYGPSFGRYVMTELQAGVEAGVRGALRMHTRPELRRGGLAVVLDDRWVPRHFLGGAVVRRGLTVTDVRWSPAPASASAAAPTAGPAAGAAPGPSVVPPEPHRDPPRSGPRPAPPLAAVLGEPRPAGLELSVDARLRRIWARGSTVAVTGIAGARVGREATVVAVGAEPVSAYTTSRLQEAYADLYGDRGLVLVVSSARDYAALVADWLAQVDHGHVRVLGADTLKGGDLLRVRLDGPLAQPSLARRGRPSAEGSELEALRRLLPHRLVELTATAAR